MVLLGACSAPEIGEEAQVLFDGETLNGWHIMPQEPDSKYFATEENFFVKDGAIHCYQTPNKNGGLLLTDQQFGDFELLMDIKSDWGCDSEIFLRCTPDGRGIQVLNDYLKQGGIGFLFGQGTGAYISRPIHLNEVDGKIQATDIYDAVEKDKLVYAVDADGWNKLWKAGDWNTIRIKCVGSEPVITTWINGSKVMEMDERFYAARSLKSEIAQNWGAPSAWNREKVQAVTKGKGSITVQIHQGNRWKPGGSAMYRNIRTGT